MTATEPVLAPHPAKFSESIIDRIRLYLDDLGFEGSILDPFAGVGRVHLLADSPHPRVTFGVELEPEWAAHHPRTIVGSVMDLEGLGFRPGEVDAIVTSPVYGNRMSDDHDPSPTDTSRRNTYKHTLGRDLSEGSAAVLQWGPSARKRAEYQDFHREAWAKTVDVLAGDGLFILNISDHIRGSKRMRVTAWHKATLARLGIEWVDEIRVDTPRQKMGANGDVRVDYESVLIGVKHG